jgi:AraC-like DNA-binding protein
LGYGGIGHQDLERSGTGIVTKAAALKLDFSTDAIPERDRLERWREVFAKAAASMDWSPLTDGQVHQKATVHRVPGLGVIEGTRTNTGSQARLTPLLISSDDLVLNIQIAGSFVLSQLGREVRLRPGDAVLGSSSDVMTAMQTPKSQFVALCLPRHTLESLLQDGQNQICVHLSADIEALRLLRSYLSTVLRADALQRPTLCDRVVAHIYDLVALTFRPHTDVLATAHQRGLPAARLCAIKSDIVASFGDMGLSETSVARRHRLTPRYLRILFAREGTTFSDYLRRTRLTRAHQLLTDRRNRGRTISSIAYEVGFGDLSHFNRLFRKQYGICPSDARALNSHQRRSQISVASSGCCDQGAPALNCRSAAPCHRSSCRREVQSRV